MPTVYVLSPVDSKGRAAVKSFASLEAARAAATKNDYVIQDAADILFTGSTLAEFHAAVTNTQPKRSHDPAEKARLRFFEALQQHAFAADPVETSTQPRAMQAASQEPAPKFRSVEELRPDALELYNKLASKSQSGVQSSPSKTKETKPVPETSTKTRTPDADVEAFIRNQPADAKSSAMLKAARGSGLVVSQGRFAEALARVRGK